MSEEQPDRVPAEDRFEWERKLRTAALSPRGKTVALTMATYGNADGTRIFPSITQLSGDTGLSTRTVDRALKELRESGYIEQIKRGRAQGRGLDGFASSYRLTFPLAALPAQNNTTPMARSFCGKPAQDDKNNTTNEQNNTTSVQNNTTKTTEQHDTHVVQPSHIPNQLTPHHFQPSPEAHQRDQTSAKTVDNFQQKTGMEEALYRSASAYLQNFPLEHQDFVERARSERPGASTAELVMRAAELKGWKREDVAA